MKQLMMLLTLVISANVLANDFSQTGVISHQSNTANELTIGNQKYQLHSEAQINAVMPYNEFGPVFQHDQLIGFNAKFEGDKLPIITEIWILE